MSYRLTTVQFALPDEDPAYHLGELRNELQRLLFDDEGWGGSFNIIGAVDFATPPGGEADHFQREPFLPGLIIDNAVELLKREQNTLFWIVDGDGRRNPKTGPFFVFDGDASRMIQRPFKTLPEAEAAACLLNPDRQDTT